MDKFVIALIASACTALVTWFIAERRIAAQHVTAERATWRKQIRRKALEVHDAILRGEAATVDRLHVEFSALLNPFDRHDCELLACMRVDACYETRNKDAKEFAGRISLLLKHDWERAKLEAGASLKRWYLDVRRWDWNCDDENAVQSPAIGGCHREEPGWLGRYKLRVGSSVGFFGDGDPRSRVYRAKLARHSDDFIG